jgi:hypothetical protein
VHFVLRFLHASHAADIRAVDCRFRGPGGEGLEVWSWPSLAGLICLAFDDDGILHLGYRVSRWPSVRCSG